MAALVADFFGIMGLDMGPPDNLSELISLSAHRLVGVVLGSRVSREFGRLAEASSWISAAMCVTKRKAGA